MVSGATPSEHAEMTDKDKKTRGTCTREGDSQGGKGLEVLP